MVPHKIAIVTVSAIIINMLWSCHAVASAKDETHSLVGSWQLKSGRYLDEKRQWIDYKQLNLKAVKVISASHFSFTTMKTVGEEGRKKLEFWAAGTGRYTQTSTHYTELPYLNSFGADPGASYSFEYEIQGIEWHTRRIEKGELKEIEVWQRLD